jgi:hypothetical protein
LPFSFIDILHPDCDDTDCKENAKYERKVTVRDELGELFTFTAFFCEKHKNNAKTPWAEYNNENNDNDLSQ